MVTSCREKASLWFLMCYGIWPQQTVPSHFTANTHQIRPSGTPVARCPVCILNSTSVPFIATIVSFVRKQHIFHSLYTIIVTFWYKQWSRINYRVHSRIFKTYLITLSPWYVYFDYFGLITQAAHEHKNTM